MNNLADDQLVAEYKEGNDQALGLLYDRYYRILFNYLCGVLGNRESAEDILQETFCTLVRKLDLYQPRGKFKPYLFRIAYNLAVDRIRKDGRTPGTATPFLDDFYQEENNGNPLPEIEKTEILENTIRAVQKLSPEQRQVLLLKHFSGLTFREISEIMGIPLNTALGRMHYAIRNLRKLLSDHLK